MSRSRRDAVAPRPAVDAGEHHKHLGLSGAADERLGAVEDHAVALHHRIGAVVGDVGAGVRLSLAQYRELAAFAQFASDLDANGARVKINGDRLAAALIGAPDALDGEPGVEVDEGRLQLQDQARRVGCGDARHRGRPQGGALRRARRLMARLQYEAKEHE